MPPERWQVFGATTVTARPGPSWRCRDDRLGPATRVREACGLTAAPMPLASSPTARRSREGGPGFTRALEGTC